MECLELSGMDHLYSPFIQCVHMGSVCHVLGPSQGVVCHVLGPSQGVVCHLLGPSQGVVCQTITGCCLSCDHHRVLFVM